MNWLTSLSLAVLVVGWLAITLGAAALARVVVRAAVPGDEQDQVSALASPLMPALGATFAVLIAITLSSEAGYLRDAQKVVSDEAATASRLAWAATSPGVASEAIHTALAEYLQATRAGEWRGGSAAAGDVATGRALQTLERVVRAEAARTELGTPAGTELLLSLDALTSSRRARLAAASRQIPGLYAVTLVAAGLALVANAGALAFRATLRSSILIVGLATVVGLSLALLFALGAPWRGSLIVDGGPLDAIEDDLRSDFFER